MHWMRSYEIGSLIISNYTHHLCKKIIMHHIIYIKKIIHINFEVHCKLWIARVLQDVKGMSNYNQDHFGVQNVKQK